MSACPYCFHKIPRDQIVFRCAGECPQTRDEQAELYGRAGAVSTPLLPVRADERNGRLPESVVCGGCMTRTSWEVCPRCHMDLPAERRASSTFTVAITGARGSGKSVYIAVLVDQFKRYAGRRGASVVDVGPTESLYERTYYERVFDNKTLAGTRPGFDDVLEWEVTPAHGAPVRLVIRDVAGEDVERLSAQLSGPLSFIDRADLTLFLFDPLMLPLVRTRLDGVVASIDPTRLGDTPEKALPKVLAQMTEGTNRLAMVVSKFDALHALAGAGGSDWLPEALANPAAHFNWDATPTRLDLPPQEAARQLEADTTSLDQELRSLMLLLSDPPVTVAVDHAVEERRVADARFFAVSSVGDSARHSEQLTLRGISPFRILDPVLWGMQQAGHLL